MDLRQHSFLTNNTETKTMTNAIEQTKREMYTDLKRFESMVGPTHLFKTFQDSLEAHLEELRKDSAASQARIGELYSEVQQWKDIAALRLTNLSAMTQDRDDCQKRMQAIDHAYCEQSNLVTNQAREIDVLKCGAQAAGEELIRVQGIARQYLDDLKDSTRENAALHNSAFHASTVIGANNIEIKSLREQLAARDQTIGELRKKYGRDREDVMAAEKLSDSLDERLRDAQAVIGHQEQLITGQRLAIADLYLAKHRAPKPEEAPPAPCANTMTILGTIIDCQQIVSDWAVYGCRAKKQMKKMAYVLNNNPELRAALDHFEGKS